MNDTNSQDLPLRLAAIPYTGAISDILDEMGLHGQVLPHEIQALRAGQTVAGRALTVLGEVTQSDDPEVIFVPLLKMLGDVKPGDVLVSQPNDNVAAHLGELSAETAQYRGCKGAVEVNPGDYILGDRDGVVVIPEGIAEEVIAKAEDVVKTENLVRDEILDGVHPLEAYRRHGRF